MVSLSADIPLIILLYSFSDGFFGFEDCYWPNGTLAEEARQTSYIRIYYAR